MDATYKKIYKFSIYSDINEEKLKTVEEEGPDEMEMAAQKDEEGEEIKEAAQGRLDCFLMR